MTASGYIWTANCLVWAAMGLYVFWMSRKAAEIDRRLAQLELLNEHVAGKE